ncbi:MAG: hypothetical protein M0Q49_05595 [Porticoccaceae bacterium]|nr:hypothetical protein [Porticoccaceae bacterium]
MLVVADLRPLAPLGGVEVDPAAEQPIRRTPFDQCGTLADINPCTAGRVLHPSALPTKEDTVDGTPTEQIQLTREQMKAAAEKLTADEYRQLVKDAEMRQFGQTSKPDMQTMNRQQRRAAERRQRRSGQR